MNLPQDETVAVSRSLLSRRFTHLLDLIKRRDKLGCCLLKLHQNSPPGMPLILVFIECNMFAADLSMAVAFVAISQRLKCF